MNEIKCTLLPQIDGKFEPCLPTRGSEHSAGLDLYAAEDTVIKCGSTKVRTGVMMEIPQGLWGNIRSRSSMATKFDIYSEAGVIDSDYRGEILVCLYKQFGDAVTIKRGDRIAQIIFQPYVPLNPVLVKGLNDTERGSGGFGSTGK